MRIQDHFSISVNLDVGLASAQVCVPLGHSSLLTVATRNDRFTLGILGFQMIGLRLVKACEVIGLVIRASLVSISSINQKRCAPT